MAVPLGDDAAIVLVRNGGARFRPVELLRLAHLARLDMTLAASSARAALRSIVLPNG